MPMTLKRRIEIERLIGNRLVRHMLSLGFSVSIFNGGDDAEIERSTDYKAIAAAMRAPDEERLYFYSADGTYKGWVFFVYGNDGYDVICDYTVSLDAEIEPVNEYASKFEREL